MNSKELQCIQSVHDFRLFYARGKFEKLKLLVVRFKQRMINPLLPEAKTVLDLWQLHGIDQNRHGDDRTIWLLDQWLDILYAEGTAKGLNIGERCRQRWHNNISLNMPSYKGDGGAPHFHFRNPFECVLEEVSTEIPPYA